MCGGVMSTRKRVTFGAALDQTKDGRSRRKCTLCLLMDKMDAQDREDLIDAMNNPRIGHARIADALIMIGYEMDRRLVARHRERSQDESSGCANTG